MTGSTPPWPGVRRVLAPAAALIAIACDAGVLSESTLDFVDVVAVPPEATVVPGQRIRFQGYGISQTGDTVEVAIVWRAYGGDVDATGLFTAPTEGGEYYVVATSERKNWLADSSEVTVLSESDLPDVPVETVLVVPNAVTVTPGDTVPLVASTQDAVGNALTGRSISWSSSDETVASVDGGGLVTAVGVGSATISATAEGKTGAATITVTDVSVAAVGVSPTTAAIEAGDAVQLTVVLTNADGDTLTDRVVAWSSSDTGVATVDSAGLVTGLDGGAATITATSEGVSGSATVDVSVSVASVDVTPASDTVLLGGGRQLRATPRDAAGNVLSGRTVSWSSSDAAVAAVNADGVATGAGLGTATITATSEGVSGSASIAVVPVPVASVVVTPDTATLSVGQPGFRLTAETRDSAGNVLSGREVTWTSSNTAVATVGGAGGVIALSEGTVTITATSEGRTGSAAIVVVRVPVASVVVDPGAPTVFVGGGALRLRAQALDSAGNVLSNRQIDWTSDDTAVATVTGEGWVTAIAEGATTISATSEGVRGDAAVTTVIPTSFEPLDFTQITDRPFDALASCRQAGTRIDGWDEIEGCYGNFSIVSDAAAPYSPSNVFQVRYPAGFNGGSAPGTAQRAWSPQQGFTKLYLRFGLKLSSDFYGHSTGTNKIQHMWMEAQVDGGNRIFTRVVGSGNDPLQFQIALQGVPSAETRTRLSPNQGLSGTIRRDQWHTIEIVLELNTPGVADGVARAWLDGELLIDYTDVIIQDAGESFWFNQVQISPTWGGGGGTVPTEMEMWIDHQYISAGR